VAGWSKRRDRVRTVWSSLAALLSVVMLLGVGHGVWAADELTPEQQRLLKKAWTLNEQSVALYQRGQYPQAMQLQREAAGRPGCRRPPDCRSPSTRERLRKR
jgi:hypothetical protein